MQINIKQTGKNLLRRLILSRGYVIYNTLDYHARMESALQGLAQRNHIFNTVVDVGASDGRWSSLAMKTFPNCNYLLIEANPIHQKSLNQFCLVHANTQFVLAAAGDSIGQISFDASNAFIGQASHNLADSKFTKFPMTTIDNEITSRQLPGPYLIKLDTHGFEVPILKGAENGLVDTEAIIIECYNFKMSPECLLFFEMCEYLKKLGFRCADLVDPRHRPYDNVLWQMDLVFLKENSHEFSYHEFY
jgi:FkbM family methyltransferase